MTMLKKSRKDQYNNFKKNHFKGKNKKYKKFRLTKRQKLHNLSQRSRRSQFQNQSQINRKNRGNQFSHLTMNLLLLSGLDNMFLNSTKLLLTKLSSMMITRP